MLQTAQSIFEFCRDPVIWFLRPFHSFLCCFRHQQLYLLLLCRNVFCLFDLIPFSFKFSFLVSFTNTVIYCYSKRKARLLPPFWWQRYDQSKSLLVCAKYWLSVYLFLFSFYYLLFYSCKHSHPDRRSAARSAIALGLCHLRRAQPVLADAHGAQARCVRVPQLARPRAPAARLWAPHITAANVRV